MTVTRTIGVSEGESQSNSSRHGEVAALHRYGELRSYAPRVSHSFSLQSGDAPADNKRSGMLRRERSSSWIFADGSPWSRELAAGSGTQLLFTWPNREPVSRLAMDTRKRQRGDCQH